MTLNALPEELIALVAIHSDAVTALKLSQTCRGARSACYTVAIFQEILRRSQVNNWLSDSLNMEALATRAGRDVSAWVHYAIADHRTWELLQLRPLSEHAKIFSPFEPELFLVNHPSLYRRRWKPLMQDLESLTEQEVYCLALCILASEGPLSELRQSLKLQEGRHAVLNDETSIGFVWALTISVSIIHDQLRRRLAAWPYTDAALVPHIPLPRPMDLMKAMQYDSLPLPCLRYDGSGRLMSNWRPDELSKSLDVREDVHANLIGTCWNGYYTDLHDEGILDPPMMNVIFESSLQESGNSEDELRIRANDCRDGIGRFEIHGSIFHGRHGITFRGQKHYAGWGFNWQLKFLSSNLAVGFWGTIEEEAFHKLGLICLWKVV